MPRKPRTTCSVCGEPREQGSRHALCERHRKAAESRNAQRWREKHPERLKQIRDAENAARKVVKRDRRAKGTKPRRSQVPVVVRRPVQPDIVIGPEAFPRVKPVGVVPGRYRRVAAGVSGWGR